MLTGKVRNDTKLAFIETHIFVDLHAWNWPKESCPEKLFIFLVKLIKYPTNQCLDFTNIFKPFPCSESTKGHAVLFLGQPNLKARDLTYWVNIRLGLSEQDHYSQSKNELSTSSR